VSEKLFRKLAVLPWLLFVASVLALLGFHERMKELEGQLVQAQEERDGYLEFMEKETRTSKRLKGELTQARALLEELVDVTHVTFNEYGEPMPHSETTVYRARERAERIATVVKAIRAFLAQPKAEGEA